MAIIHDGAPAMAITLITMCFQAIKAAIANPAKTLRSEETRLVQLYIYDFSAFADLVFFAATGEIPKRSLKHRLKWETF